MAWCRIGLLTILWLLCEMCYGQELTIQGTMSYGNYEVFGTSIGNQITFSSIEYDQPFFHKHLVGSQVDWAMEVIPAILLSQAAQTNNWGVALSTEKQLVYGLGVAPVGFKLTWGAQHRVRPYLLAKGAVLVFDHKALQRDATYENFCAQFGTGLQIRLTSTLDLRLGLWNDMHFSNAHTVASNPGTDLMYSNVGLTYKLRRGHEGQHSH